MAIAAGAVAAAAVAASAGSAALSAKGAKKGGSFSKTSSVDMPMWAKMFNRGTADLLDEQRGVLENAASAGALAQPEMWKLLGFDPVYDDQQTADLNALSAQADQARQAYLAADNLHATGKLQIRDLKRQVKKAKGADKRALKQQLKQTRTQVRQAAKSRPQLAEAARTTAAALGQAQTVPRRLIGLKPAEGGAPDPTGSKDNLFRMTFDLQNETLMRALKGEEPIDSTLRTAYDEKERALRNKLQRAFGPDYENSTPGGEALRNFERERAESFEQFNRITIQNFSALTEARANALSNLTGARIEMLASPMKTGILAGGALGAASRDRDALIATFLGGATRHTNTQGNPGGPSPGEAAGASALGGLSSGLFSVAGGIGAGGGGSGAPMAAGSTPAGTASGVGVSGVSNPFDYL